MTTHTPDPDDDGTTTTDAAPEHRPVRIAFVCVRNAGRSQMALAFAERAVDRRGLADDVDLLSGGTDPADAVHDVVVDAMAEVGVDIAGRVPREITLEDLRGCDYVATMGCSTLDVGDVEGDVEGDVDVRDWALPDPHGKDPVDVAAIRDEIERRVDALVDEVARERRLGGD